MDWLRQTASAQGRAIMAGLLDPVDLTEAYLDAAAAHPYRDRIYARLTTERARDEAIAARGRARAGLRRGLLDGVVLSWKDNIDSAGVATEAGSALLQGRTPDTDAAVLRHAQAAGAVCLGKVHMTELAFTGLGLNPVTATPPNHYDAALAPGGSSSGSAVSVAQGLASASVGTDTGGSIRLPSAWNGLVGFKASRDAVPREGVVPLCAAFDTAGPIARSVEDCAEIFAAITATPAPDLREAGPQGLRLLVLEGAPFKDAEEAPVTAFEEAVEGLARAGAQISRANLSQVDDALSISVTLFAPEAYGTWRDQIEDAPELMYPPVLKRFRGGAEASGADYVAAWQQMDRLRPAYAARVAGFDAVILPTAPIMPPNAQRLLADADYFAAQNLLSLRNTRIANLFGLPAISVPTARPACGLMAMGRAGGDRQLLRVAAGIDAALAG
ncbi:MAG: amidase family protein [Paracoccus sp. (in: a-proteobacteria)]|nr:amidase family protein [Paracoccus sp. (in: a-proteobacteria)]